MHQLRSEAQITDSVEPLEDHTGLYHSIDPAALFLASPDAIVICDAGGRVVLVNDQLCSMFGYREQQLKGQPIELLVPSRLRDGHLGQRMAYTAEPRVRLMGQCREVVGLRSDGREISLEIRLRLIDSLQGSLVVAAIRDITEIRMLGAICKKSKQILELIATGRPTPEVLAELVTSIENWTPGARCSILRLDPSQPRFHSLLAPRLPNCLCEAIDGLALGELWGPCSPAAYRGERVIIHEIDSHPEWATFRDLAREHQLRACWSEPIRDAGGAILGSFAVYHDEPHSPTESELEFVATAAHLAGIAIGRDLRGEELVQKEDQLRQAQKLDAVGTLAGGIAHEFNNLLQVILGYTICVIDEMSDDDPSLDDLELVRAASEQARDLTRQILSFSRRQPMQKALVEINAVVLQVSKLLRPLLDARIELIVECDETVEPILADAGQLQQVLVNLSLNARDAIVDTGRVAIFTQAVMLDDDIATRLGRNASQPAVRVSVSDSGSGMSPTVCAKVFDPFFTTKPVGQGTGLGLSVVHGIVRDHQGAIEIESEPGSGTTFHLYFPIVEQATAIGLGEALVETFEEQTNQSTPATQENVSILVADDDPLVRRQLARTLAAAGYHVITAEDGDDAICKFRAHADELRLAVLDIIMPKCDGRSVAQAIHSTHREFPIIFLTGYDPTETINRAGIESPFSVIFKPVEPAVLLENVRQGVSNLRTRSFAPSALNFPTATLNALLQ